MGEHYELFLSKDDDRPNLQQVHYDGKYGYASNGRVILRWEEKKQTEIPLIDFNHFFKGTWLPHFYFSIEEYKSWKEKLPLVKERIKCDTCRGNGKVDWEFEHWNKEDTCPNCNGDEFFMTDKMVPDFTARYNIKSFNFSQENAELLMFLMRKFKTETVKVFATKKHSNIVKVPFADCDLIMANIVV